MDIFTEGEVLKNNMDVIPNSIILGDCLDVMKNIPDNSKDNPNESQFMITNKNIDNFEKYKIGKFDYSEMT